MNRIKYLLIKKRFRLSRKGRKKSFELSKRLFCTFAIMALYILGRNIMLYGVNVDAIVNTDQSADNIILNLVSGDYLRCSIFAIGIMPSVLGTLLVQLLLALLSKDIKNTISPKQIRKATLAVIIALAVLMANDRANDFTLIPTNIGVEALKIIIIIEMTLGAIALYYMTEFTKNHGVGGMAAVILVNVIDNLKNTLSGLALDNSWILVIICICVMALMIEMELDTIKIPVQRVSIHNIYADKNYIAFKPNPIGIMPVMFATAFYMLPVMIVNLLIKYYPTNEKLIGIHNNLLMTKPLGMIVYLAIIILLTVTFSFILLAPGDIADNLQRMGDSIVNVYAGRETKRFLRKKLLVLSLISGIIMASCMGASLYVSYIKLLPSQLAMFPSTVMILTSLACNIGLEVSSYIKYDSYNFFL